MGSNCIKVYSTYPFNGTRDISIAAGRKTIFNLEP